MSLFEQEESTAEERERKNHPKTLSLRSWLYKKVLKIAKEEKLPISVGAYMIGANSNIGSSIRKNKDISLYTFIRLIYLMGYELAIVKSDTPFNWKEDKLLTQRYNKHKTDKLHAKRRERGLPEGELPTKIRIKRKHDGKYIEIINRRRLEEAKHEQNDLFSSSRSSDALSRGIVS